MPAYLRMSVHRGRPKVAVIRPNRKENFEISDLMRVEVVVVNRRYRNREQRSIRIARLCRQRQWVEGDDAGKLEGITSIHLISASRRAVGEGRSRQTQTQRLLGRVAGYCARIAVWTKRSVDTGTSRGHLCAML